MNKIDGRIRGRDGATQGDSVSAKRCLDGNEDITVQSARLSPFLKAN